jgi:arylsulfatase A
MLTRRQFIRNMSLCSITATLLPGCTYLRPGNRPNIVLILVDDLGYGDLGCYGNQEIKTPYIDQLADQGVRFTSFYSNGPECTPTRTALLTGRYQHRVGGLECALGVGNVGRYDDAIRLRKTHDMGLPVEELSIARMLKDTGYSTAIYGKWHLGYESKFSPNNHGFDSAYYAIGGAMDYFAHIEPSPSRFPALYLNGKNIQEPGYFTDLVTNHAIEFIKKQNKDVPFFLYLPYTAPHSPYQGPGDGDQAPLPDNSDLWNQGKAPAEIYRTMIEYMDSCIGKIFNTLELNNFADSTLIIFMSDNGASRSGSNQPFSGFKGGLFEGGIRVPCIVNWPAKLPAKQVSDQPCMTMDFSASIIRAAGTTPPSHRIFDGIDILKLIETKQPLQKRTLFWRARRGNWTRKAVRDGDLKFIWQSQGETAEEFLFDLAADPVEKGNLVDSREEEAKEMRSLLKEWEEQVKSNR